MDEVTNIRFKKLSRRIQEVIAIEREDALKAGTLGFLHRGLTLCSMIKRNYIRQVFK